MLFGSTKRRSRIQRRASLRRIFIEQLESRRLFAVDMLSPEGEAPTEEVIAKIINGTVTTQYPSVGIVGDSSGGFCTGTLIAPRYVLTAAHCAVDGSTVLGNTQGRFTVGGSTISTSQVIVHPNYSEATFGTDTANDIALLRLNQDVTNVTPSPIFRSIPTAGTTLTLVGFGGGGTGNTGTDGSFGTKRVGTTPIDRVSTTLIHWNFDNNAESNTAPGDSGGPAFINVGGILHVAGVTSGGTLASAAIGDESYDTRVDVYQAWIDSIVSGTTTTSTIQYATGGSTYTENFDLLTSSGTGTSTPTGFTFNEVGTNGNSTYTASNGAANAGDTYSFGANGATERALGSLLSSSNTPTLGAAIQNKTGQAIVGMTIGYTGEQWRLGTAGRQDKLDFQYSLNATGLTDGTWVDVNTLDFISPTTTGTVGALDGNAAANRSNRTATISSLNVPNEAVIWIRWSEFNASGADDGIGIDSFTFSATTGGTSNTPPTITKPADIVTTLQTSTPPIAFTVGDAETAAASLIVTASSSNTTLLPNTSITLGGSGGSRNVVLTPANGQSGTSTITLTVSDGTTSTSTTFLLTVQSASNSAPTITKPADVVTAFQTPTSPIGFTIGDAETAAASLVVTASSSNTTLVPNSSITLGGAGANRTVVLTPANGQSGTTTITLNVADGTTSTSTTFLLTVQPAATGTGHLRIVSWNFSGASGNGSPRAGFDTLIAAMGAEVYAGRAQRVDLLALQEVLSQATTSAIVAAALNNTYSTTAYAHGVLNGATTGAGTQGVVYNSQTLTLLGEAAIGTASTDGAPRQTLRYKFRPVGTFGESDFFVYNSHWKASDNSADAQRRLDEARVIRDDADALGQGAHIIYVGDYNLFRSTEPAYVEMLSAGNGQAFDPINRPGNWSGNSSFRDIFTQAPAVSPANGLDGGGMDDRLDFQLNSGEFSNGVGLEYRPGSYHTFGNNGSVPVNGNIDDPSSTALPGFANRTTLLTLLRNVCDHLPVVADYTFPISSASIANRQVFYNRSTSAAFGNGSGNPVNAIDPSKSALLPGQTATLANYTANVQGINGLIVDINGGGSNVTAADFQFANWDGINGTTFNNSTATPTVSVLPGVGTGGSNRIKIEFLDQTFRNTWLRVTVLANSRTGLASNDVFYFGNAVGDTGVGNVVGPPAIIRTNATDTASVRQNQSPNIDSVAITNLYDINKDGRVNATDTANVRQNQTPTGAIALITAPSSLQLARRLAAVDAALAGLTDDLVSEATSRRSHFARFRSLEPRRR